MKDGCEFRVLKRFLTADYGFIEAEVDGERRRFEVYRKGNKVFVDGVPLSQLRLLFIDHERERRLSDLLKAEVYRLLNQGETGGYLQKYQFLDSSIYLYDNGYIRIYKAGSELYQGSLEDGEMLKLKLLEIAKANGLKDSEAVTKINEFFSFCRQLTARLLTIDLGDKKIRYADGKYVRQVYAVGDYAYIAVYVYGEIELKEKGVKVVGVTPIWYLSSNGFVKRAETVPAFIPSGVITADLKLIRSVVLDAEEFNDLEREIERINRGEAEPPSFSEVWTNVEAVLSAEMKLKKEDLYKAVSYTIACWFYDFLNTFLQVAIVGPSGSGKTELRDRITFFTRTVPLTQGSSLPAIRRIINTMFPGIAFDEKILFDSESQSFLRASYRKGSFIILADKENADKVYSYDPYGPRILTCLPRDYDRLREDTLQRHIAIHMVRSKIPGRIELFREKFWPIIKTLYLLMLYRWREFLNTWQTIDMVLSRHLAGHTRDVAPTILTSALLAGEEKFKVLYEGIKEEYKLRQDFDERLTYLAEGIIRYAVSQASVSGDSSSNSNSTRQIWINAKKIVEANEGIYDEKNREHKTWVRRLGHMLKTTPRPLPFVKGFSRKNDSNYHLIDLKEFFKYIQAYNFQIPEELDKDEKVKKFLETYGISAELETLPSTEEIYKSVSFSVKTPQTPQIPQKQAEGVISEKEAQNELISEKPESSSFPEKKPESNSSGISGVSGILPEKDTLNNIPKQHPPVQTSEKPKKLEVVGEPIEGICEFCGRRQASKVIKIARTQRYICHSCLKEQMEED